MTMTIDHERYAEFSDRLAGPEGIDLQRDGSHKDVGPTDTSKTVAVLRAMGFGADEIASSLSYFSARGGFNDREILLGIGITAGDEEALAVSDEEWLRQRNEEIR